MTDVGGVPLIPGSPEGLRGAAAELDGAAGRLEALGGRFEDVGGRLANGWSGIAADAAIALIGRLGDPLPVASGGFTVIAQALRRYATELEEAQKDADRARDVIASAQAAATAASGQLDTALAEPEPDQATVTLLEGRVQQAADDAYAAFTAGRRAYERAEAAARRAAATIDAIASQAPEPPPPPPPPPPPEDDRPWYEKAASATWGGLKDAGGAVGDAWNKAGEIGDPWRPGSPAFAVDVLEGAAGVVAGAGQMAWQGLKATPQYERFDPEGSEAARQGFADGFEYMWHHPWDAGKQILGVHHFENGEPGKFAGEAGLTALLALASGGAGAAAKVTSGTSKVANAGRKVTAGAATMTRMRAATKVDDLRALGVQDYTSRLPREASNFNEKVFPVTRTSTEDEWLVGFGDASRQLGDGRSAMWWTTLDEAKGFDSVEDIRDSLALPERWDEDGPFQTKDEAVIIKIPEGTETTRLEGTAKPQLTVPDPRPGGGHQIAFREIDLSWVEARMSTDDLLAGHRPRGVPR